MTEAETDVIARLAADTQDSTVRAALLIMLSQQRAIASSIEVMTKIGASLDRFERAFGDHREEFRVHVTTEDAVIRTGLSIGKWASSAVIALLAMIFGMGVWMFQILWAMTTRDAAEQRELVQRLDNYTKRLDQIEQNGNGHR